MPKGTSFSQNKTPYVYIRVTDIQDLSVSLEGSTTGRGQNWTMAKKRPIPSDYTLVLEAIKKRVRAAQYDALKAVNRELITLYWDIGGIIVARQKTQPGADPWWRKGPLICSRSFRVFRVFQRPTCGECAVFTRPMPKTKNSHQWCEKSAGVTISWLWKNAIVPGNVNSTSANILLAQANHEWIH